MQRIHAYISERFTDLSAHRLFHRLSADEPATRTLQVMPHLTFWSFVFQDILVLNEARVGTPALREIIQTHGSEDMGHELWFLHDLRVVFGGTPEAALVFDREYLRAREFCYAFMSEVYIAGTDHERMLIPHILEEGAKIFLPALIAHFERAGVGRHLRSLGRHHLDTEATHALHSEGVARAVAAIRLSDAEYGRARAMVDRCHATFTRMATVLDDAIANSCSEQEAVLEGRLVELRALHGGARREDRPQRRSVVPTSGLPTLSEHVVRRLLPLSEALSLDSGSCVATFRDLVAPWADAPNSGSGWLSEISDDNTPIELSVTFDRKEAALRVLFEPQADEPTLDAYRSAGLAFLERLEAKFGADLSRFRRVQDLFVPRRMQGRFAVWSSVVFTRDEPPAYKVYLNPNAQGRGLGPALVEEALGRLGMDHAWAKLCEAATRRGPYLDEIKYFALDLSRDAHARVKVYIHHHGATAADLEAACSCSKNYASDSVLAFARAMRGGDGPMTARAPFTCHAFTSESAQRPTSTVYVPVCAYAQDDAEVYRRHVAYLEATGIDPSIYRRVLGDAAPRRLDAGVGLQSWIALRCDGERPRISVYLATEARDVYPPGTVPAPSADPLHADTPAAVAALLAERPFDAHPLVRGLARSSLDARKLRAITDVHRTMWRALDELYVAKGFE